MTDFPDLKMKAVVQFPAKVLDGTGIDIVKSNGSYQFNLDFGDFAPPVASLTDPTNQNALLWNKATGQYNLIPVSILTGSGVFPATAFPLIESGSGAVGASLKYAREDHVHPAFGNTFQQAGTGAVVRTPQNKMREIFSALDFGATGDGSTDDSAAIQAALTAIAVVGNGALYLPGGRNYKVVGLTWSGAGYLSIFGDGPGSILSIANTSGTLFTGTNGIIDISDMLVQHPTHDASIGGFFFKFSNAKATLHDMQFLNGYNVARWEDGCDQCGASNIRAFGPKNDLFNVDVSPAVPPAQQHGNIMFDRITAQAFSTNTGAGLRAASCDGLFFSNSLLAGFQNGVIAQPLVGRSYLANLFFTMVVADGAGGPVAAGPGWYFDGTNGPMLRVFLTNCWAGAFPGRGAQLIQTKTFSWNGGSIIDNGNYGIVVDAGCQDILLNALVITGNSAAASGTTDGVLVFTGADKVRIKNCRIGPAHNGTDATTQTNSQNYGIRISNVGTVNYELTGNDVSGNITGGIIDAGGSGGRRIIRDNPGYNPIGISTITLGASPASYTAGATPETVFVAGGTVTSISVAGTTVCGSLSGGPAATIQLNPNQSMIVTYSSVPTVVIANKQ